MHLVFAPLPAAGVADLLHLWSGSPASRGAAPENSPRSRRAGWVPGRGGIVRAPVGATHPGRGRFPVGHRTGFCRPSRAGVGGGELGPHPALRDRGLFSVGPPGLRCQRRNPLPQRINQNPCKEQGLLPLCRPPACWRGLGAHALAPLQKQQVAGATRTPQALCASDRACRNVPNHVKMKGVLRARAANGACKSLARRADRVA
jgi:hypothetical protein